MRAPSGPSPSGAQFGGYTAATASQQEGPLAGVAQSVFMYNDHTSQDDHQPYAIQELDLAPAPLHTPPPVAAWDSWAPTQLPAVQFGSDYMPQLPPLAPPHISPAPLPQPAQTSQQD